MTSDQDNLHPMNRGDYPQPDWKNPDWKPEVYPAQNELPGDPVIDEAYRAKAQEIRDEAARLWPTLKDYLRSTYDMDLAAANPGTRAVINTNMLLDLAYRDQPLLKFLEPRRIVPPGGFPTPKCVAASLYSTLSEVMMKYYSGMTVAPVEVTSLPLVYALLKNGVPIFYIDEEFARAVAATELPGDFILQDLKWPRQAMALAFPEKFMREYTGRDVGYVFAATVDEGDNVPPKWLRAPIVKSPNKMIFQFHTYTRGMMESFVTSWLMRDRVDGTISRYQYTDYTHAPDAKVEDDHAASNKIGSLLLKLLVVLNIRPALVKPAAIQRPAKVNKRTGKVEAKELWSPNFIGFDYRPQRQEGTGTHASPRWHWRRGHITHQRVGSPKDPAFVSIASLPRITDGEHKGEVDWLQVPQETRVAFWNCHKRLWLEPTLINFDESEEAPAKSPASESVP